MTEPTIRPADELIETMLHLDRASDHVAAQTMLAADADIHMAKYSIGGISVAPADAKARVLADLARRYDEAHAAAVLAFARDLHASERDLEGRIEQSKAAPRTRDDLRELLLLTKWRDQQLHELVDAYRRLRRRRSGACALGGRRRCHAHAAAGVER